MKNYAFFIGIDISKETLDFALIVQNIVQFHPLRLLDLCIKFFQEFVTWEISQSERKPEPVGSALPSAAELETHGPIQGSTGYYSQDSCGTPPDKNLGKTHARVMNVNSFSGLQFYKFNT